MTTKEEVIKNLQVCIAEIEKLEVSEENQDTLDYAINSVDDAISSLEDLP